MLTVAVILILGIGFCLGWKEIAYSYSDIHVADIMSVWPFLICLIISMTVGTGLMMIPDSSNYLTSPDKTFIVLVSMMLTIVIPSPFSGALYLPSHILIMAVSALSQGY